MNRVYYTWMQKVAYPAGLILAVGTVITMAAFCDARPTRATQQQASQLKTAALEAHEGLTISALPWLDPAQYKAKFGKKSPLASGLIAIQVTLRNDTEESLKVNLDRIRLDIALSEENRQSLDCLSPEDVADRVFNIGARDPSLSRRSPFPIHQPTVRHDKHWTEMENAAGNAALPGSIIGPHKTMEGLLYFDLQKQFDLLSSAKLYIPEVISLEKNRSLLYFEIDLGNAK